MGEEGGGLPSASDIVVGQVVFRSPSSWLRPAGRPGGSSLEPIDSDFSAWRMAITLIV